MSEFIHYLKVNPMLQMVIGWVIGGGICFVLGFVVTTLFARWLEDRP